MTPATPSVSPSTTGYNGKKVDIPSYSVKVGDVIAIRFGARTLTVEVVSVTENVGKDAAAAMYKEV